jgi:hypothetical protein
MVRVGFSGDCTERVCVPPTPSKVSSGLSTLNLTGSSSSSEQAEKDKPTMTPIINNNKYLNFFIAIILV